MFCIQTLQLFREKRLSGLKAVDIADTIIETMDLPKAIQGKTIHRLCMILSLLFILKVGSSLASSNTKKCVNFSDIFGKNLARLDLTHDRFYDVTLGKQQLARACFTVKN